jgi:hypothetical protein
VFHRTPDGGLRKALLPGGFHVPRDFLKRHRPGYRRDFRQDTPPRRASAPGFRDYRQAALAETPSRQIPITQNTFVKSG